MHRIFPKDLDNLYILAAILNSTLQAYFVLLSGRSNLGAGALKFETVDARQLLILDPNSLTEDERKILIEGITRMGIRRPSSLFVECGLDPRFEIKNQIPEPLPDRKMIDDVIFDALNLNGTERIALYHSTCELVKKRLKKAKILNNKKQFVTKSKA